VSLEVLREVAKANRDAFDEETRRRVDEALGDGGDGTLREGIPVTDWRALE
jgi:hypothetical protein